MNTRFAALVGLLGLAALSMAAPPSMEESQRQTRVLERLQSALGADATRWQ